MIFNFIDKPSKRLHPNARSAIFDERKSRQVKRVVVTLSCSCFVAFCGFSDCDTCSAYKTQVANDCDAIHEQLRTIVNLEVDIRNYASGILSQPNINATIQHNAQSIDYQCQAIYNRSMSAWDYIDSINNTAQSLVCSTNSVGSCECAPLLEDLISDLAALSYDVSNILGSETNQESILYNISQVLTDIKSRINGIATSVSSVYSELVNCNVQLSNISGTLSDFSSKITTIYNVFNANFWQFRDSHLTGNPTMWSTSQYHFLSYNNELGQAKTVMQNVIVADDFLRWLAQNFPLAISSLNNYQYANYTNNSVVSRYLDHIERFVSSSPAALTNIVNNLRDFGAFFTNTTSSSNNNYAFGNSAVRLMFVLGGDQFLEYYEFDNQNDGYYSTSIKSAVDRMTFKDMVVNFSKGHFRLLTSLNNYAYSELSVLNDIRDTLQTTLTNLTLKSSLDLPERSPLDGVSSDYFAYLTNSYLSAYSGTNPNTNWFRRVEILLAALVFQTSSDKGNANSVSNFVDQSSEREALEDIIDTDSLFDYDFGSGFYETLPQLPQFGDELPQRLLLVVPRYGSSSASDLLEIEIDLTEISTIANVIRACFRFLWWSLVAVLLFILGRFFLRGCFFAFKMIQGINL